MVPALYGLIFGQGVKDAQSRPFAWVLPKIRLNVLLFILFSGVIISIVAVWLSPIEVALIPSFILCFAIYIVASSFKNQSIYFA